VQYFNHCRDLRLTDKKLASELCKDETISALEIFKIIFIAISQPGSQIFSDFKEELGNSIYHIFLRFNDLVYPFIENFFQLIGDSAFALYDSPALRLFNKTISECTNAVKQTYKSMIYSCSFLSAKSKAKIWAALQQVQVNNIIPGVNMNDISQLTTGALSQTQIGNDFWDNIARLRTAQCSNAAARFTTLDKILGRRVPVPSAAGVFPNCLLVALENTGGTSFCSKNFVGPEKNKLIAPFVVYPYTVYMEATKLAQQLKASKIWKGKTIDLVKIICFKVLAHEFGHALDDILFYGAYAKPNWCSTHEWCIGDDFKNKLVADARKIDPKGLNGDDGSETFADYCAFWAFHTWVTKTLGKSDVLGLLRYSALKDALFDMEQKSAGASTKTSKDEHPDYLFRWDGTLRYFDWAYDSTGKNGIDKKNKFYLPPEKRLKLADMSSD
jgi:hypothetical protein